MEKSSTDDYFILLKGYSDCQFQDFKSSLTNKVGLDEDNIQLISKQFKIHFIRYEIAPGNYSIKVISKIVYTKRDRPGTLRLVYDDISMKTKFVSKQFRGTFVMTGTLRFVERS